MFLLMSRKEVVKLQSRLCDFVLNFQVSRRTCYIILGRPNLVIYHWNFANPCKDFGARAKKHLLAASHRQSGRASYKGVWGCPLNLPTHNCRLSLNRAFKDGS